jgi:hypothetical protein
MTAVTPGEATVPSAEDVRALEGKVFQVDYGDLVLQHDYRTPGKLSYVMLVGPFENHAETVDITVTTVRGGAVAVAFCDTTSRVVAVVDLAAARVDSIVFFQDAPPQCVRGRITEVTG